MTQEEWVEKIIKDAEEYYGMPEGSLRIQKLVDTLLKWHPIDKLDADTYEQVALGAYNVESGFFSNLPIAASKAGRVACYCLIQAVGLRKRNNDYAEAAEAICRLQEAEGKWKKI